MGYWYCDGSMRRLDVRLAEADTREELADKLSTMDDFPDYTIMRIAYEGDDGKDQIVLSGGEQSAFVKVTMAMWEAWDREPVKMEMAGWGLNGDRI